jgi:hypothetical protein
MKKLIMILAIASIIGTAPAQDIGLHRICIGMTFGDVQAAWGNPVEIKRHGTTHGLRENWWYRKNIYGLILVMFDGNGRVSYIGHSLTLN